MSILPLVIFIEYLPSNPTFPFVYSSLVAEVAGRHFGKWENIFD
jgi:hypothetical protein